MKRIVHKELSYLLTGVCFQVHRELGRFCSERQYCDLLEKLLKQGRIDFVREYELQDDFSSAPKGNKVDFLIEQRILLDAKAKKFVTKEDYLQMQRYLRAANLDLGLIVNFRNTHLKPQRVLNSTYSEYSDVHSNRRSNLGYSDVNSNN